MVHLTKKAILDEFGGWMAVNKEAVFNTRPWKIFGEDYGLKKTEIRS